MIGGAEGSAPLAEIPPEAVATAAEQPSPPPPQRSGPPQPIWENCNKVTMNLETALHQRITESPYYRELAGETPTLRDVLDLANRWDFPRDMAAWVVQEYDAGQPCVAQARNRQTSTVMVQGGVKGRDTPLHHGLRPSHAWCLLYRLFGLGPTRSELQYLIGRNSKAHVRCLGLLYVRFTQPPWELLPWFAGPLEDSESIVPVGTEKLSLSDFARAVVREQRTLGTIFPRVPERVLREFRKHLGESTPLDLETEAREAAARERAERLLQQKEEETQRQQERRRREQERRGASAPPALADPSTAPNPAERRRLERLRRKQLAELAARGEAPPDPDPAAGAKRPAPDPAGPDPKR